MRLDILDIIVEHWDDDDGSHCAHGGHNNAEQGNTTQLDSHLLVQLRKLLGRAAQARQHGLPGKTPNTHQLAGRR